MEDIKKLEECRCFLFRFGVIETRMVFWLVFCFYPISKPFLEMFIDYRYSVNTLIKIIEARGA